VQGSNGVGIWEIGEEHTLEPNARVGSNVETWVCGRTMAATLNLLSRPPSPFPVFLKHTSRVNATLLEPAV
jgi:hypothetical protein